MSQRIYHLKTTIIFVIALLVAALALASWQTASLAQEPTPESPSETQPPGEEASEISHTLIGREHCLICHEGGFGGSPIVPVDHQGYSNEICQDCHKPSEASISEEIQPVLGPFEIPTPIIHPPSEGLNSCFECHIDLGDNHTELSNEWQESVHGKAGITCADCHGGDPTTDEMNQAMTPEAGYIGVPRRALIPGVCGGCHSDVERMRQYNLPTDQYIKYIDSVHGTKVMEGDTRVAICVDCHGSHNVKKASDPSADVYPLNVPMLCARCHSDPVLMETYDIPTDQFETYQSSIHGKALLTEQDVRAPNCASCHGSHAAKPPASEEVANVCGKCHTATEDYYRESLHSRIGDAAPKCWTCHGTHDIVKPSEDIFFHPTPPEPDCGYCHVDEKTFRMDKDRFSNPEDRRCDTCHHPNSRIMVQVRALHTALTGADLAYREADDAVKRAGALGMIVTEAEARLAEARTSLIRARAALHTTKLPVVTELTDDASATAKNAKEIAEAELGEYVFRRQAMVIAIVIISIIVATLTVIKRELYHRLDEDEAAQETHLP